MDLVEEEEEEEATSDPVVAPYHMVSLTCGFARSARPTPIFERGAAPIVAVKLFFCS